MNSLKKLHLKLRSPFVFVISIIITLLDMTSLYTVNEIVELDVIHQYQESGDYAQALKIARSVYEEFGILSGTITCLENKLLTLGYSMLLFDEHYQPRDKLLELLKLVGMKPLNESKKAITEINDWAQKNLLRKGERWEKQTDQFENLKPEILPILKDLGFVNSTCSSFKTYQGAIVHGALLSRVRIRLHYLVDQWKQGVRFSHLYFLSGARPLEPQYESRKALMDDTLSLLKIRKDWQEPSELPKTECEMMELVWNQSDIPEEMRSQLAVYFINAPMKKDTQSGKFLRPNTDDTVIWWLKVFPPKGRYLAITNAPYTNRQDLVVRSIAPNDYTFDTIGPEASEDQKMIIFLDELARLIFQIKQLSEK